MIILICFSALIFSLYYEFLFGVWIIPEHFKKVYNFSLFNFFSNIFGYGFYLAGMFLIFIFKFLNFLNFKIKFIFFIISILLAINNKITGEMDFGSFQ